MDNCVQNMGKTWKHDAKTYRNIGVSFHMTFARLLHTARSPNGSDPLSSSGANHRNKQFKTPKDSFNRNLTSEKYVHKLGLFSLRGKKQIMILLDPLSIVLSTLFFF